MSELSDAWTSICSLMNHSISPDSVTRYTLFPGKKISKYDSKAVSQVVLQDLWCLLLVHESSCEYFLFHPSSKRAKSCSLKRANSFSFHPIVSSGRCWQDNYPASPWQGNDLLVDCWLVQVHRLLTNFFPQVILLPNLLTEKELRCGSEAATQRQM